MLYLACLRFLSFTISLSLSLFKCLSQHLKIGRVYILKSIFLASTEKFGRSSSSVPHSHMVGDREHEAAALRRFLGPVREALSKQTQGRPLAQRHSTPPSTVSQLYPITSLACCLSISFRHFDSQKTTTTKGWLLSHSLWGMREPQSRVCSSCSFPETFHTDFSLF